MKKYFLFFFLIFLAGFAFAQDESDIPPRPNPPRLVNDLANMLAPEEVQALEQKLVNYNDSTSTQIAIVTVTSLGPYDVSDFAYRIGETWGVGGKGKALTPPPTRSFCWPAANTKPNPKITAMAAEAHRLCSG